MGLLYGPDLQILLLLGMLIPAVLFLWTEYSTLKGVRRENRLIQPGWVWMQLIPLIGQVWQFFVVTWIADSIRAEVSSRTWSEDSVIGVTDAIAVEEEGNRPTFAIGIAYCTLNAIAILLNVFTSDPSLRILAALSALAQITCWIIYWVQLGKYKRKLQLLSQIA